MTKEDSGVTMVAGAGGQGVLTAPPQKSQKCASTMKNINAYPYKFPMTIFGWLVWMKIKDVENHSCSLL